MSLKTISLISLPGSFPLYTVRNNALLLKTSLSLFQGKLVNAFAVKKEKTVPLNKERKPIKIVS